MTYEELKDRVKEVASAKLGNKAPDEALLNIYLEETELVIVNYIHYPEVPEKLKYTWANMLVDLVMWGQSAVAEGEIGTLSSLSEGDTSMSFNSAPSLSDQSRATAVSTLLHNYTGQLQEFRDLFSWGVPYDKRN